MAFKELSEVRVSTRAQLWRWLAAHAAQKESAWLIYPKASSGKGDLAYADIVDDLLCFGWIDSLPRAIDETYTSLRISPRNPKSRWSAVNKKKVARLMREKRMQPQGLRVVKAAKLSGTWTALDAVERLELPEDLRRALTGAKKFSAWEAKARSWKRGRLEQLLSAKGAATRTRRIAALLAELA